MTSSVIRERFLSYFAKKNHTKVVSSPVIPWGDLTLLFTNAGMNQFKDVFLGLEKREYTRAVSCQKCIRAGGKHNDLDEVGHTTRHGTFLEMLGNFSFGDYFKEEAILFAWEFLTKDMGLDPVKLYPSVYSTDEEAFSIWTDKIGVSKNCVLRLGNIEEGDEENFWSMGPVGPCGPCSEIYYDRGINYGPDDPYECFRIDSPRYLELWNLVFMQYNRLEDGLLEPLPKPSIDTGLGLERMAMILQNKENIFETDILGKIISRVEEFSGHTYTEKTGIPFRAAADHVRTLTFAIADGAIPSNEGRGYVLRRILRRASRYLRKLDVHEPLLYRLVSDVVDLMGEAYPEINQRAEYISLVIKGEEERFLRTLDQGIDLFEKLAKEVRAHGEKVISGENAFRLYDTYGFPIDLTRIMAEEKQMSVDMSGFTKALEAQRERAREASAFAVSKDEGIPWNEKNRDLRETVFEGFNTDRSDAELLRWRRNREGEIELVFDRTPFYAFSGGQVSDTGMITPMDDSFRLGVKDVRDMQNVGRVHICTEEKGEFTPESMKMPVVLTIDTEKRRATERNHSATHLLQAALIKTLGDHVRQSGSAVDSERLRFDFNHFSGLTRDEIESVEDFVNREIIADHKVSIIETSLEEARKTGAMCLFDEKYSEIVRLVQMEEVSFELCGGTHVTSTGVIGPFRILSESSVAAGIRRIEAVTGFETLALARKEQKSIQELGQALNAPAEALSERIEMLQKKVRELEKEVKKLKTSPDSGAVNLNEKVIEGVKVAWARVEAESSDDLKIMADSVRSKLKSGVAVIGAAIEGKVSIVTVVTDDIISGHSLKAGDVVKRVAEKVGGSGGGKPHMAMAGGKDVSLLDKALESSPEIVAELLKRG